MLSLREIQSCDGYYHLISTPGTNARCGCLPTEFVNRLTRRRPDGGVATEEAQTELSPGAEAQRCRSST